MCTVRTKEGVHVKLFLSTHTLSLNVFCILAFCLLLISHHWLKFAARKLLMRTIYLL